MKCRNYGHRGFSAVYPENTMLAFEKALEAGCEGMEFDVHLTADQELVIIHDESIVRTSGKEGLVKDMTLAQLRQVDFSYKWARQIPFQPIPTLRDYFELVKDRDIMNNIELKTGVYEYPGIEAAVWALIREYHMEDRVIISSFNHHSVLRMKALAPHLPCGFLSETWILDVGNYVASHGVEAYHPQFHMLTDAETAGLKAHGVAIITCASYLLIPMSIYNRCLQSRILPACHDNSFPGHNIHRNHRYRCCVPEAGPSISGLFRTST